MAIDSSEDQAILAKLDRLNELLLARDPAIVDELWSDLGFRLAGAREGEVVDSRAGLAALFEHMFSGPSRISFAWGDRHVDRCGDVAWVFADSRLTFASAERTVLRPYRVVFIFQRVDGRWFWRLFSGSEPTPAN